MAAGADLAKVFKPGNDLVSFPKDLPVVESAIRKHRAKLLVVDPILGCIGDAKTDTNAESHVRRFLAPLKEMVRRTGVAAALIRHFKKEGASAIHRGLGSQAWTAMCRLQHVVGDPDGGGKVVLACGKSNLAKKPQALGYRVEQATVHPPEAGKKGKRLSVETSRIEWVGEVDATANDVAAAQRRRGRPAGRREEAVELIRNLLAEGEMDSGDLQERVMRELGIAKATFEAARQAAGVAKRREGFGKGGKWVCRLGPIEPG
jgi:hypothetical protein